MQAKDRIARIVRETIPPEVSEEARRTGARLNSLLRHLFLYDRGNLLRVIEESGFSLTEFKILIDLGGVGGADEVRQITELAAILGVSVPSTSRAVDSLVKAGLLSRVEDSADRRVRRITITAKGKSLVDAVLFVRQASMEAFAAGLTATQRRKLDAAIDALMGLRDIAETYEHLLEEKD
jgi:DNA-binding MarR family transcriptional regulator